MHGRRSAGAGGLTNPEVTSGERFPKFAAGKVFRRFEHRDCHGATPLLLGES